MTIAIYKYQRDAKTNKLVKVYLSISGKWIKTTGGINACYTQEQATAIAKEHGAMTRIISHRY